MVRRKYPKKYKRKTQGKPTVMTLYKPIIAPDVSRIKLIYTDQYQFSGSATKYMIYRGTGAYDPDWVNPGRYCAGWINMVTKYRKYYCTASKIQVRFISTGPGVNTVTSGQCVCLPLNVPTVIGSKAFQQADEPYARDIIVGGAGGKSISTLTNYMTYNKFHGRMKSNPADDSQHWAYTQSLTTSQNVPSKDFFWHIIVSSIAGGNLDYISAYVKIVYYVTFFEREDYINAGDDNELNPGPTGATGTDPQTARTPGTAEG